jgi:hypothetical protein
MGGTVRGESTRIYILAVTSNEETGLTARSMLVEISLGRTRP